MLEIPIYLLVLGAMGLVAVFGYVHAQRHLNVMEAVFLMAGPRTTMMEYRAVTGVWPTSNSQTGFSHAMFRTGDRDLYRVNSVRIREAGAVDFRFSRGALKGKVLTIRAWAPASPGLPVEWLCGQAPSLPSTTAAADQTTLSTEDLPSHQHGRRCRIVCDRGTGMRHPERDQSDGPSARARDDPAGQAR